MRHRSLHVATLLSFVAASAMVVIAVPSSTMPSQFGATVTAPSADMRAAGLIRRKAYETVLEKCKAMVTAGKEVDCPDINDVEGMRAFMKDVPASATGAVHAAAPLKLSDIDDRERGLLRWYQRVGVCPLTLDEIVDGLYDLCVSFVGERGQNGQAQKTLELLPNPTSPFPVWTLDDLIRSGSRLKLQE